MDIDIRQRGDMHGEERARAAVLDMTRVVLGEVGYQQLRVETVAARAGVPRVWLRRWWTTRPLLVAEALQRMSTPPDAVPSGDVRADVRAVVVRSAAFLADPLVADAVAGLTAEGVRDPVAAARLATLLGARRAGDAAILLSAVARGDLRHDTDVSLLLDLMFGMLMFRTGRGVPPTAAMVDKLVDVLLRGQVAPPEHAADGHQIDGHQLNRHQLDGHPSDGHQLDGYPSDGHQLDGYPSDGHQLDGYPSDGHQVDGYPSLPGQGA